MDELEEATISLDLHPLEASILLTAINARIEDLEGYRDTWSISETIALHGIAKRIPDTETVASKDANN